MNNTLVEATLRDAGTVLDYLVNKRINTYCRQENSAMSPIRRPLCTRAYLEMMKKSNPEDEMTARITVLSDHTYKLIEAQLGKLFDEKNEYVESLEIEKESKEAILLEIDILRKKWSRKCGAGASNGQSAGGGKVRRNTNGGGLTVINDKELAVKEMPLDR